MILLLASALSAHAATFTAEDLVTAHARGLPADTSARMAESVGTDAPTAVYLLRRGVSADALATWGYTVGEAERAHAERLGAIATVTPRTRDAWVDARSIDAAIQNEAYTGALPTKSPRMVHVRRGQAGVVTGALFAAVGSVAFASGVQGVSEGYLSRQTCCVNAMDVYTLETPIPSSPKLGMMALGAVGFLGAAVSFHFGARELSLAGAYPDGWSPAPEPR